MPVTYQIIDLCVYKNKNISNKILQGLGIAAMNLSFKLYNPVIEIPGVYLSDSTYSQEQLVKFESDIMADLNGNLLMPTLYSYISYHTGKLEPIKKYISAICDLYKSPYIYSKPFSEIWQTIKL